jgi:NADH-quinone oxidoreductase subunit L
MNSFLWMVTMMLASPLFSAIGCLIISNRNQQLISWFAVVSSFITFAFTIGVSFFSLMNNIGAIQWDWFYIGNRAITISFEFDQLAVPLLVIVSTISFLVNIYSVGFFKDEKSLSRYFSTLSLFSFSMIMLALSGNLLQLFIFWELVGLCSYLLIGYYRTKAEPTAAATKSFIMNKIGDVGFLIALMILWSVGSEFQISDFRLLHLSWPFSPSPLSFHFIRGSLMRWKAPRQSLR